ncbi:hypothetical protein [Ruminococcus sp. HUN007]|uniref:hypothetical protein n=1 Tax=Ruminococcus sp. HUN007 TaxID=1514668 RepID=UPI0005D21CD3|nr:hypothetical protein [Ruminococcus sp. HUN007]
MDVKVYYEPLKLIKQKNLIANEHKSKKDFENPPEGFIEKKIKEISGLKESALAGYSDLLKDYELQYLAYYLPKEKKMDISRKIKLVLLHRSSQDIMECYYNSWQNYFDNNPDNYNQRVLMDLSENGKYLRSYSISIEDVEEMIMSSPYLVLTTLISKNSKDDYEFVMQDRYNIKPYSRLGKKIIKSRYLYCSGKDYIKAGQSFLCDIVNEYDVNDKTQFFINFVTKMNKVNLAEYLDLEKIAERFIGPDTEKYNNLPGKIKTLLNSWFNAKKINDLFGEGERGQFWRARALEYNAQKVVRYGNHNMIVMTFPKFVATEFLDYESKKDSKDKKYGPIYIMPTDVYENIFLKILQKYHETAAELKSDLFHEFENSQYRIVHRSGWRESVYSMIRWLS